jgi:hypothetical protein
MVVGDTMRVRAVTFQNSQLGLNVYYFRVVSIVAAPSYEGFTVSLGAAFSLPYRNCLPTNALYRGVGVSRILPTPTLEFQDATSAGAGLIVSDPAPLQMAGILTKRTVLPGKANRGRAYIPFVAQSSVSAIGEPTGVYQGFLNSLAIATLSAQVITSGITSAAIFPVLFHKARTGPLQLATAMVIGRSYVIVTTGTTDFVFAGAADNNPGTIFTYIGGATGSGTVRPLIARPSTTDLVTWRVNPKFAAQHRRGDYGKLNTLPF